MNVHLFGGKDRFSANETIVPDNEEPEEGEIYAFDYKKGLLVIAVPDKD